MLLPAPKYGSAPAFAWPAALFLWGPGSWSDLHRHHSVQLVFALRGSIRFRERARARWVSCGAVVVNPDAWHEIDARGAQVLIGFVDVESDVGAALGNSAGSNLSLIPPRTIAHWRSKLGDPDSLTAARVEPWVRDTLLPHRRLMHLFTASVGVPLRPYVLWLRLQYAAGELARGRSAAAAGHEAGFSDAAHFTRTFRRMLGATPRQVLRRGLAARDFHV
jgi:AraC-like DNA-binding protein